MASSPTGILQQVVDFGSISNPSSGFANIDGGSFVVINTSYGILRVVYAGATGKWFTI